MTVRGNIRNIPTRFISKSLDPNSHFLLNILCASTEDDHSRVFQQEIFIPIIRSIFNIWKVLNQIVLHF